MGLIYEILDTRQKVLIVDKKTTSVSKLLTERLKKYNADVFVSPVVPKTIRLFDYFFVVNEELLPNKIQKTQNQILVMIFIEKKQFSQKAASDIVSKKIPNAKVISLGEDSASQKDLEKILWFTFSKHSEVLLRLESYLFKPRKKLRETWSASFREFLTKRNLVIFSLIGLLVFFFGFLPFLGMSSFFLFQSQQALRHENIDKAQQLSAKAAISISFSKKLYSFSRPAYLLFSLALLPDLLLDINEGGVSTIQDIASLYQNGNRIVKLIFSKDKSPSEKKGLQIRLAKIKNQVLDLESDLSSLNQKLPDSWSFSKKIKQEIENTLEPIEKTKSVLPHLEEILGDEKEKKYLLLFANNMELRPGGGFIGSFGVLTLKNLTFSDIKIYDVYDADGQLTIHVEPPQAIRIHLNQPNWFLRDSAFSSDFYDNYTQAKFFLDKEMGFTGFSGGILLTTSAIQNILEAYESLILPDFKEKITKDNFYIKAQLYSEKKFFPGSIQKKSFLAAVTNQILLSIDSASGIKLLAMMKKSLDEKQIVFVFEDQKIQSVFDSLYWSGKTILPTCVTNEKVCVVDYIFPVDANLGVNKANFFVTRNFDTKIRIDIDGTIKRVFTTFIKNESPNEVFPGGPYKNYFQLSLPKNANIQKITKNDTLVESYDETVDEFKTIGFLLIVPEGKTAKIQVEYQLGQQLPKGEGVYQLIFQKQIGSKNSDFSFMIQFPKNISLVTYNFSPVVKDQEIFYNTTLTADKIFFVQVSRQ